MVVFHCRYLLHVNSTILSAVSSGKKKKEKRFIHSWMLLYKVQEHPNITAPVIKFCEELFQKMNMFGYQTDYVWWEIKYGQSAPWKTWIFCLILWVNEGKTHPLPEWGLSLGKQLLCEQAALNFVLQGTNFPFPSRRAVASTCVFRFQQNIDRTEKRMAAVAAAEPDFLQFNDLACEAVGGKVSHRKFFMLNQTHAHM